MGGADGSITDRESMASQKSTDGATPSLASRNTAIASAAATAAPTAASASSSSSSDGKAAGAELKAAYREFNDRMKTFIGDLVKVYGKTYPGLTQLGEQIAAFTCLDPSRMMLAHKAWPMFSKARVLIERRDESVFTKHDVAGLKARAGVDTKVIWAKASPTSREAMWRAVEDMCDRLDDINDLRRLPEQDEADDDDQPPILVPISASASAAAASAPKKSSPETIGAGAAAPSAATTTTTDRKMGDDKKERRQKKSMKLAQEMMSTLKHFAGDDDDGDYDSVMKKLSESDGSEPTEKDQEMVTRLLTNFVNKLAPGGGEDDDAELEHLPERARQAEKARRQVESVQKRLRMRHAIGKLTQIESLQKTTDPSILQRDAQEAAAEKDRLEHPEKVQANKLSAHFNYKVCVLLQKMHAKRGNLKSKVDGRILFPAINTSFAELLRRFKENPASRGVIEPVGAFIAKNRKKLVRRDDRVFSHPTHPFLVDFNSADLWATFKPHEREAFWDLVAHPISLATIDHDLHTGDLADVAEIVDDILAGSGVAYDTDPKNVNGKEMVMSAIEKGVAPAKLARIHKLFARMSNDPDQKTIHSIHKLMKHVLPQAMRARGIDIGLDGGGDDDGSDSESHDEDEDDIDDDMDERDRKVQDGGKSASDDIAKRLEAMLSAAAPTPTPTPTPAPSLSSATPAPPTPANLGTASKS